MRSVVDRNVVMRRMTVFKQRAGNVCVLTASEPELARRRLIVSGLMFKHCGVSEFSSVPVFVYVPSLRAVGKSRTTVSFVMSVRSFVWNNSALSGRIFVKFDIGVFFFENLPRSYHHHHHHHHHHHLLQLSCHSVAVVLTPVRTKQIRINIHKRNNTKTQ